MEPKGYYTRSTYRGWVGNRYMEFPTETEYLEYIQDL